MQGKLSGWWERLQDVGPDEGHGETDEAAHQQHIPAGDQILRGTVMSERLLSVAIGGVMRYSYRSGSRDEHTERVHVFLSIASATSLQSARHTDIETLACDHVRMQKVQPVRRL